LVRPLLVEELHERVERPLHRRPRREVLAAELDAPVLVQDGALQAFDKAIGPRMAGASARLPDPRRVAGLIEAPLNSDPP
jgi:hypothetical protein